MPGVRSRARIAALTTLGALAAAALGAVPAQAAEVTFTTADGVRISATYTPAGTGKAPAVILAHMFGGDRSQWALLVPQLRRAGIASLAYDIRGMGRSTALRGGRTYRPPGGSAYTNSMPRDVRAAVGWLRRRPDVDPSRIGYVGWSAGARTGAIVAGVEPRLRTVVLMSGGATPISSYAGRAPASLRPAIRRYLGAVDPLRYVPRATGSALLLQDGRRDQIVPRSALDALAHAAPKGTTVRWYDADHGLNAKAYHDQLVWLARKLRLSGPPVKGALTGP